MPPLFLFFWKICTSSPYMSCTPCDLWSVNELRFHLWKICCIVVKDVGGGIVGVVGILPLLFVILFTTTFTTFTVFPIMLVLCFVPLRMITLLFMVWIEKNVKGTNRDDSIVGTNRDDSIVDGVVYVDRKGYSSHVIKKTANKNLSVKCEAFYQ